MSSQTAEPNTLHRSLWALSWEHQVARGTLRTVEDALAEGGGVSAEGLERLRLMATHLWTHRLEGHQADEESVFLTAALRAAPLVVEPLAVRMESEHRALALAARRLQDAPPAELAPRLQAFVRLVEQHLAWEETELWPVLEQVLPGEVQEELAAQLDARRTREGRGSPKEGRILRGERDTLDCA